MEKQLSPEETIKNLQTEIDHLKDVIEKLAAITSTRIQIEQCEICGYYQRSGDDILFCSECGTLTFKDCQDKPCCSGSGSSSQESS